MNVAALLVSVGRSSLTTYSKISNVSYGNPYLQQKHIFFRHCDYKLLFLLSKEIYKSLPTQSILPIRILCKTGPHFSSFFVNIFTVRDDLSLSEKRSRIEAKSARGAIPYL